MAAEDAAQISSRVFQMMLVSRIFGSSLISVGIGDFLDCDQIYSRFPPLRSVTIPTGSVTSLQPEVHFRRQRHRETRRLQQKKKIQRG